MFVGSYSSTRYKHTQPTIPPISLTEGPMLETSTFNIIVI